MNRQVKPQTLGRPQKWLVLSLNPIACLILLQGNDVGTQYASVIFTHNQEQADTASKVKAAVDTLLKSGSMPSIGSGDVVTTAIVPAQHFYPAMESHQQVISRRSSFCI